MPKNILFTSWYTGLGGGETDLLSLAQFLDPNEWTPHLLVPRDGVLAQKWRENGWHVHITTYRGASVYFIPAIWERFPVVDRIVNIIRENQIDVISSEYHTLPYAYSAAKKTNTALMWTVHGWWFKPKFWQRNYFCDIPVVARSKSIRDGFLGEPPFIPKSDIPVIYSGVDTERFKPDEAVYLSEREGLGILPDTPIVAMVARFQPVKGHHTFQAMAREIAQQLPSVQFVVAGEDTFGVTKDVMYRQEMLDNASSEPLLRDRLHYVGFRDDVEAVLASADVIVCASEFESYGKVNIEAMASATPVVSTNRGGPTETVVDGVTGFLVAPNDPQALAKKVITLLKDDKLRKRLGNAGRQHVIANFSAQTATNAYIEVFRNLS